jgi:hypothetical protein
MTVTLQRLSQVRKTDDFTDNLSGTDVAAIEGTAVDSEDFLTGQLSQFKRIIHGDDSGNWFDNIMSVHGGNASLKALYNRGTLEGKNILTYLMVLNDLTVTALQNWMELTGLFKPGKNIAYGASAKGAVCAKLAGAIGSHSLTESSGSDALHPKNLVQCFDGDTGDAILSAGRKVHGLLQVGTTATDGNAFADSGADQGQISFVRPNATFDDLEACPVGDIAGKKVVYAYTQRDSLKDTTETEFRGDLDAIDPSGVTVSLDSAYDGGEFMTVDASDVDIRLADTKSWVFRKGSGGAVMVKILRTDAGTADEVLIDSAVDKFTVKAAVNSFWEGITADDNGQDINIGVTTGQIDSATLELEATTGDLNLKGALDVNFTTDLETGGIDLDDATAGKISTLFSQSFASISAAIKYAGEHGGADMSFKVFTAGTNYAQGDNIPAAVQDLTAYPIDANTPAGVQQLVFLNGRLLFGGNGTTKNDVYAGTTPASGDVKVDFAKGIKTGDVIISVVLAQ